MDDESAGAIADAAPTGLTVERWVTAAIPRDNSFWKALAAAAVLHSLLFLSVAHREPRQVGAEDGSQDGISVSVVTEADLQGRATVADEPAAAPGQPAPQAPPPAPPPQTKAAEAPPPPEAKAAEAPPPPEAKAAEAPPVTPPPDLKPSDFTTETTITEPEKSEQETAVTPPETAKNTPDETAKEIAEDVPDILALPGPGAEPKKKQADAKPTPSKPDAKKSEPQKSAPAKPVTAKQIAKLDLSPPPGAFSGGGGGAGRNAGFERPPGITRSGANDDFARGVIRALQQTMPQLRQVLGRVTVRILLNENGNVSDVQVIRSSAIASLDQSVMFAAKQTSYPFPPPNSNLADRTFMVTYIYH